MSTFTDAARRAFLSALATATGKTQTPGDITITGMLEVGSRRAIGERVTLALIEGRRVASGSALIDSGERRAVTASSKTLQVFIQVNKVAARGRNVIEIGLAQASSALQQALRNAGITTEVSVLFAPNSIKGPGTFACASQYVYNELTNRCCNKDTFSKPPSDPARYLWLSNGCDWICRSTYKGSDCLTCTEYKANLWKPDDSAWDDTSPTCTFKCLTGFIKSDTGVSTTIHQMLSSHTRIPMAPSNASWPAERFYQIMWLDGNKEFLQVLHGYMLQMLNLPCQHQTAILHRARDPRQEMCLLDEMCRLYSAV